MTPFTIDAAQIVGLFMESVFYGLYLATLYQCLRCLTWSEAENWFKRHWNWPMLVVALALCLFATLDVAFGLRHNLDAFVYYTGPGGAIEELHNISYWVNVMKTADYVAQTFIGDAILIYRCWVVYNGRWLIVLPSILFWLGGTACGAIVTYIDATLQEQVLINNNKAAPWVDSMTALTLAMNIITTSLIIYRIWSVNRRTSGMVATINSHCSRRPSRLESAMRIIIESAALYTLSVIIFAITYVTGNNAQYGTSDNVVQIIGISFNLIIIRVDSGRAFKGTFHPQENAGFPTPTKPQFESCAGHLREGEQSRCTIALNTVTYSETFGTQSGITVNVVREEFTDQDRASSAHGSEQKSECYEGACAV